MKTSRCPSSDRDKRSSAASPAELLWNEGAGKAPCVYFSKPALFPAAGITLTTRGGRRERQISAQDCGNLTATLESLHLTTAGSRTRQPPGSGSRLNSLLQVFGRVGQTRLHCSCCYTKDVAGKAVCRNLGAFNPFVTPIAPTQKGCGSF